MHNLNNGQRQLLFSLKRSIGVVCGNILSIETHVDTDDHQPSVQKPGTARHRSTPKDPCRGKMRDLLFEDPSRMLGELSANGWITFEKRREHDDVNHPRTHSPKLSDE